MKNRWTIQVAGEKILLGIYGTKEFIERSLNFAYNYEVIPEMAVIHRPGSDNFCYIGTKMRKLTRGLKREGRVKKVAELAKTNPEIDDLSEHYEEIEEAGEKYSQEIFENIENEIFCLPSPSLWSRIFEMPKMK